MRCQLPVTGALALCLLQSACGMFHADPAIEFTVVPDSASGGATRMEKIAGRVLGARKGDQIVLFAWSGRWWVQPFSAQPFTAIRQDETWSATIHMGSRYAALLVGPEFPRPRTVDVLPQKGGAVIAVATVNGKALPNSGTKPPSPQPEPPPKPIHFSGYDWEATNALGESAGVSHANSASNVWTDDNGWLHMRITRQGDQWVCSDVTLSRSLGYGSYSFVLHTIPRLEPGTVLGMFTWDPAESGQNNREMDIELSQWGDPAAKNAQFVVQPYYVPANVFRFVLPPVAHTESFQWTPARVSFRSVEETPGNPSRVIAEHVFTSGIPSPGDERIHLDLYIYGKSKAPQERGVEVVFEKFEFLP